MKVKLTEEQLLNLISEQSISTGEKVINKSDFENYIKKYEGIKIKTKTITPEDFLTKLNNSPIQLNMFHIQTEGWDALAHWVSMAWHAQGHGHVCGRAPSSCR